MSTGAVTYSNSFWTFSPGIAGQGTGMPTNSGFQVPTFATPPNPAGTFSTSKVMAGLGGAWRFTPLQTGKVKIHIWGSVNNVTTGDGVTFQIAYGTGTAPVNGATASGTTTGSAMTWTAVTGVLTSGVPFCLESLIAGLTVDTPYWFDLQFESVTGGASSFTNLTCTAEETW